MNRLSKVRFYWSKIAVQAVKMILADGRLNPVDRTALQTALIALEGQRDARRPAKP